VPKVLRVGLSPRTSPEKQAELDRIFGQPVEVVSLTSPDVALIVERARTETVDALAVDAGSVIAAALARELPQLPILRPEWHDVERTREYRNERGRLTPATETAQVFGSYVRLSEGGALEALRDGELR
jgi:hypothetical protein